jgi:hypothetical protein
LDKHGETKVSVILKKNATLNRPQKWMDKMEGFLQEYKVISGEVPSEKQFRIRIRSRQEDTWLECSTEDG